MESQRERKTTFGVELWGSVDARAILDEVQLAERLGFDSVWLGDSQLLWRETYVLLGAASALTSRVLLGTAVTNPITRHPTVTASAILTLQETSGGRALLGVSVGSTSLRTLGQQPVSRAALSDWIGVLRELWTGEPVTTPTGPWRLLFGAADRGVPILIAGRGPRMLRLAGQIGDGAIVTGTARAAGLQPMLDRVYEGRAAASEPGRDFRVYLSIPAAVDADPRKAYEAVRPQVAVSLNRPRETFSGAAQQASDRLRASYDYYQHMSPQARWTELIPDEVVPEFALAGTAEACARQLRELVAVGLDEITLIPYAVAGSSRTLMVEALKRQVVDRL